MNNEQKPQLTIPCVMCWAVDNLELLKSQPDESVDLIYSDILYGTGRNFGDYQDLKPIRSEIENHYIPRLIEMKRVLKPTGTIYLQMDTRINHWMRILMDDVFGYDNLLAEIIWYYDNGGGRRTTFVNKKHDVIISYSKTSIFTYNAILEPYKETSGYAKGGIVNNGKKYMPNVNGKNADDVWCIPILNPMSNERVKYQTQKPKELIKRIVKASSNEGDVVADYYLGSGTTAVVCKELNRNFIGCDINPKAIEITKARLNVGT
jgi:site-specific DNA-methyltransferase (adenine-specific)